MIPFVFAPTATSYSLLWPIHDVKSSEPVTRDFLSNINSRASLTPQAKQLRLSAFFPHLLNETTLQKRYERHVDSLRAQYSKYAQQQHHTLTTHVSIFAPPQSLWPSERDLPSHAQPASVFCNIELVRNAFAKRAEFQITTDSSVAEVLWLYEPLASFLGEFPSAKQIVNQIPNEKCITLKDLVSK